MPPDQKLSVVQRIKDVASPWMSGPLLASFAVLIVLFVLAVRAPTLPFLSIVLLIACLGGAWLSLREKHSSDPQTRIVDLLTLYAILVPFSLIIVFLAARRSSEVVQVTFDAVRLSGVESVRIGANTDSLDVALEASIGGEAWRLRMVRGDTTWAVHSDLPPEELLSEVSDRPGLLGKLLGWIAERLSVSYWTPINGVPLSSHLASAVISYPVAREGAAPRDSLSLELEVSDTGVTLTVGGTHWHLINTLGPDPAMDRFRLRGGGYLSQFPHSGAGLPAPLSDLIRIRQLGDLEYVGDSPTVLGVLCAKGAPIPWCRHGDRFLLSVAAPLAVESRRLGVASPTAATQGVVQARSGGDIWRFAWQGDSENLRIDFESRPPSRRFALTPPGACPSGVACNVVGLRRQPPPTEQFLLSDGGLDSTRFELFGRFVAVGRSASLITGSNSIPIATADSGTWVRVRTLSPGPSGLMAEVHFVAKAFGVASLGSIFLLAGGLCLLLFGVQHFITTTPAGSSAPPALNQKALMLALSGVLALALLRLILGLRLQQFAPYLERGLDTALAVWLSLGMATVLLVRWRRWSGHVATWILEGVPRWIGPRLMAARLSNFIGGLRPHLQARDWLLPGGMSIFFLVSPTAFFYGLLLGATVALMWAVLAGLMQGEPSASAEARAQCAYTPAGFLAAPMPLTFHLASYLLIPYVMWLFAARQPIVGMSLLVTTALLALLGKRMARTGSLGFKLSNAGLTVVRAGLLLGTPLALLGFSSRSGSASALALATCLALVALRMAVSAGQFLEEHRRRTDRSANDPQSSTYFARIVHLHLLLHDRSPLPVVALVAITIGLMTFLLFIDPGLMLIVSLPILIGVLLGLRAWYATPVGTITSFVSVILVLVTIWNVLIAIPTTELGATPANSIGPLIRQEESLPLASRVSQIRRAQANVVARGLAAKDQGVAERVLALAPPSRTTAFLPAAIEQTWGTRAYADGGRLGKGIGKAVLGGRGVAVAVSYAENSFAVYVMHEHGRFGALATFLAYGLLGLGTTGLLLRHPSRDAPRPDLTMRALLLLSFGMIVVPAGYVAVSNTGVVPITGQNMPFLGLNAWSDVVYVAGVLSFFLAAAMRLNAETLGMRTLGTSKVIAPRDAHA